MGPDYPANPSLVLLDEGEWVWLLTTERFVEKIVLG